MTEEFPLWVREEAAKRINAERSNECNSSTICNTHHTLPRDRALCRLLLETMPEPVDPLVEAFNRLPPEWDAEMFAISIRATLDSLGLKIVEADQ
jgi:hypothetical protein